jgi:hypothetical protein
MANVNTIWQGGAGSFFPQFANLANPAAEAAWLTQTNTLVSGVGGAGAVAILLDNNAVSTTAGASGSIWENGKPFIVRMYGRVTTGTTTNVTLKWYQVPSAIIKAGTQATLSNDVGIVASTARAVNTASATFKAYLNGQYDSTSGKLMGTAKFLINGLLDSEAAFTSVTLGINADTELNFLPSLLFSATNAANVAILTGLEIDQE